MSDLTPNEFEQLVALEEMLADLSVEARRIADESGLSRRAIAERMGHSSPSTVQRLVGGAAYNATIETLARFAWACGFECKVELVPRSASTTEEMKDVRGQAPAQPRAQQTSVVSFDAYRKLPQWSWRTARAEASCASTASPGASFVHAA